MFISKNATYLSKVKNWWTMQLIKLQTGYCVLVYFIKHNVEEICVMYLNKSLNVMIEN